MLTHVNNNRRECPAWASRVMDHYTPICGRGFLGTSSLRPREHSIVELIGRGYSNKEIGRELGITPETVKSYLKRLFRKLKVRKRAQAVTRAQELGFLRGSGRHRSPTTPGDEARI